MAAVRKVLDRAANAFADYCVSIATRASGLNNKRILNFFELPLIT